MTPQELKHSIIFLALQGKLVEQIKGDAPIDLSGIKSKKTEECEFDIPDSWELAHLETVTNGIPSKQYQILESEVQQTGRYPVISQSKAYSIGFSDDSDKVYHHTKPVIVFGDHTTEVKHVEFDFVVGADGVKIFEPIDGIVTADFLFYVFLFYSKDLSKVGGYSRHYKFIKNKPVPLPPLAEQKRIVAKIEELLPLIDRYEQAWSKLEDFNKRFPVDMQKSILQMAIQGKLVPQLPDEGTGEELFQQIQTEKQTLIKAGKIKKEKPLPEITEDEIPFDIPETWMWVRLGSIISLQSGADLAAGQYNAVKKGVPYITGASNFEGSQLIINRWTECPNNIARRGDLLLTCKGTVGKTTILSEVQVHIARQLMAITPIMIDVAYLQVFIQSQVEGLKSKAKSMIPGIERSNVLNLLIPLPPLAEQKRIVAKLEEILPLCERLK